MTDDRNDDQAFDSAARNILRGLPVPELPPVQPPRREFLRRGLAAALGLAAVGGMGWMGASFAATPRIIRLASAHAEEEEMLHGLLVEDMTPVLQALSLPTLRAFPGILQLCKNCTVGPYPAWHLNAFMDNLGPVQVFAFQTQIPDAAGQGWWFGQHWRFLPAKDRLPVLLLSRRRAALDAMAMRLSHTV